MCCGGSPGLGAIFDAVHVSPRPLPILPSLFGPRKRIPRIRPVFLRVASVLRPSDGTGTAQQGSRLMSSLVPKLYFPCLLDIVIGLLYLLDLSLHEAYVM